MNEMIKERLKSLSEEEYRKFNAGLIPNVNNILGVRAPLLRKLAKEIIRGRIGTADLSPCPSRTADLSPCPSDSWRGYLRGAGEEYFEEVMLQGYIIGGVEVSLEERLEMVEGFVPKINNWAVCDSFVLGLKFVKDNPQRVWDFLQPYFVSIQEYELRFAVVMMFHFINDKYLDSIFQHLDAIRHDGYYVKMAVAWVLSACYVMFPERTMSFLKCNSLDHFTFNKTLQKIIESNRIDKETKNLIRDMKQKK